MIYVVHQGYRIEEDEYDGYGEYEHETNRFALTSEDLAKAYINKLYDEWSKNESAYTRLVENKTNGSIKVYSDSRTDEDDVITNYCYYEKMKIFNRMP